MTLAPFRAGRLLVPALCLFLTTRAFAAPALPFRLTAETPKTLTPAALTAVQKDQTPAVLSADGKTLTFTSKTVRLVAVTGPDSDMLSYRIGGVRNPTLAVGRGAALSVLFVNTDDDMTHNLRFGTAPKSGGYPNDMAAYVKASAGTPELPHTAETVLHGDEIIVTAPEKPGAYAYFCTVRGHAAGGMAGTVLVQDAAPPAMSNIPGMTSMPGMTMSSMPSSVDLNDPMSQEASGTAWLPSSTPMYGKMVMLKSNMLMLHGAVMPRYTDVGSKRGDRRFDAPNWFMGMFSHPLTPSSQLGLRAMLSLDPVTEGGYGYPLLFQTGETWHGQPLHDRQHPHNFQSELSATYSRLLGGGKSAFVYLADPGEPALGPPTYMHRLLAYDLADAPIGHHWQDATHIQFGVATAGINFGSRLKFEASQFTGREPDENRWSFQKARFDSSSGRVSLNPNADNAFQVSYGFIRNAEGDGTDQHRTTASWLYNRPLGEDANFTTALVWGQNNLNTEGKTNSYLAEADYQRGRDTLFTRIENIQKSGRELVLPEDAFQGRKFTLGAYTLGYVRDVTHGTGIDTGVGFAVTADQHPSALSADYGSGVPLSFQVYLRLRPSRMRTMSMAQKDTPPAELSSGAVKITAVMTPNPPKARQPNTLTLTITDAGGKALPGAAVTASVAMTSMDMGTTHPAFQDTGSGRYTADVSFAMPGPWRVSVTVAPPGGGPAVMKALDYAAE